MGVETTAYSISPEKLRKLRANHDLLDFVLGFEDDPTGEWTFEDYSFGRRWEETAEIFGICGFPSFMKKLNPGKFWDCDRHEVWAVTPLNLGKVARDLESADFEKIKAEALAKDIRDYWGGEIREDEYDYYIGDIKEIREFLQKTSEQGNYLLFSTA